MVGPARWPSPASPPCRLPPWTEGRARARRTLAARRPPPAYLLAAGGTRGRHALPSTPLSSPSLAALSPDLFPLLCSLFLSARAELVAANRRTHSQSHPLASPTHPRAPRRRPRPPHRATPRQKPRSAVPELIFNIRPPATSSSIRRRLCFPDLASLLVGTAVSSTTVSP